MLKLLSFLLLLLEMHGEGCIFDITTLNPQPLVLTSKYEFIYPTPDSQTRNVTIEPSDLLLVSCPGSHLLQFPNSSLVAIICNENNKFQHEDRVVDFSSLTCQKSVTSTTKRTGKSCGNGAENSEEVHVGFQITSIKFVTILDVCLDTSTKTALYVNYSIPGSIEIGEAVPQLRLIDDPKIYDLQFSIEEIYNNSLEVVNGIVGLQEDSRDYLRYSFYNLSLATYYYEFFYSTQVSAAARYINTSPQWPFSGWNWDEMTIEMYKNFIKKKRMDLQVYVGTYGTATLPHYQTGEEVEIYLYEDEFGRKAVPVPAVTWKLVYHRSTKRAIVVLTINTPRNANQNILCKDISGALSWLDEDGEHNYRDISRGYTYACSYNMLKDKISHLPKLDVTDILV